MKPMLAVAAAVIVAMGVVSWGVLAICDWVARWMEKQGRDE